MIGRTKLLAAAALLLVGMCVGLAQKREGEVNTPPARGERHPDKLKVGDAAPDFTLPDPTGKNMLKLSDFQGKKPVVMIFGSHT